MPTTPFPAEAPQPGVPLSGSTKVTLCDIVVDAMDSHGVARIFGVPGGGSSLQVIEAAAQRGIPFVLTRSETPALIMAAVTGELSGQLGAALTTKGPGVANGLNGLAYALLDRAPMVLLSDGFDAAGLRYQTHQVLDQAALVAPLTKGYSRLVGPDPAADAAALFDLALTHPHGPVCVEFTAGRGAAPVAAALSALLPVAKSPTTPDPVALARAAQLLRTARRPVVVAGLQAVRDPGFASALERLVRRLGCPVFATYKAKGVLPDTDPLMAGLYVGGAGEAPAIASGDLVILFGADPVEFALQPWRYGGLPVIEATLHAHERHYTTPDATLIGALDDTADALLAVAQGSDWQATEIARIRDDLRAQLLIAPGPAITPQDVIDAAVALAPDAARITVDAGAHMLTAMAFWQARRPGDVLISNGLATMGFSLPAAIAAALHDPARPVIAFTGDGGLAMCLGELGTAVQQGCDITVVVFNDSALSMIGVKQVSSGLAAQGVAFSETDFAAVARGFGMPGFRCDRLGDLSSMMAEALAVSGPSLLDVRVDPAGYSCQVKRLRG